MIDYIALSIGHGLIAIALLRLVTRDRLDVDPLLGSFSESESSSRKARGARSKGKQQDGAEPGPDSGPQPRRRARQTRAQAAQRAQKTRAQVAKR
ncbi:MAG: hypothetical protein WBA51_13170 [Erythrobacter sp.]